MCTDALRAQTYATPQEKANGKIITEAIIDSSIQRRENNNNGSSEGMEGGSEIPSYSIAGPDKADRTSEQSYTLVPRGKKNEYWYVSCGTVLKYYDDMITIRFGNALCTECIIKFFGENDELLAQYTVAILGDPNPLSAGAILTGSQSLRSNDIAGSLFAKPAEGGDCDQNYEYQWQYSYDDTIYQNIDSAVVGDSLLIDGYLERTTWFRRKVTCNYDTLYTGSVAIFIIPPFSGGIITTPSQFITSNTLPSPISATAAVNGDCNNNYTYKWQKSPDGYLYEDIAGATGQNLSYGNAVSSTIYFRRKAFCDTLYAFTNPIVIKIISPPPVLPQRPQTSIDTLLAQEGINIESVFGIISDSVANGRAAPDPALDSLDRIYRQRLELSPFGSPVIGLEQSDLDSLAADPIMDNVQQRLVNDSLGLYDTAVYKNAFIPVIQDSTIQRLIADSSFQILDSLVRSSAQLSFEDAALILEQQLNDSIPVSGRSYVPSVLPSQYSPGAVINGPSAMGYPYTGQVMNYTAQFYFPPSTIAGDIRWVAYGGTIVSQNTNPVSGNIYANVSWTSTPGLRFIALYDQGSKQFDMLQVYVIPSTGVSYPPLQKVFYGQTPCQVQAVSGCTSMNGYTYTFQWQSLDVYATGAFGGWKNIPGALTTAGVPTGVVSYQPGAITRPWMMYRCVSTWSNGGSTGGCTSSAMSVQLEVVNGGTISAAVTDFAFNTIPSVTQTAPTGGYTASGYTLYYEWEFSVNGGPWTYFGSGQAYPNYAIRYSNTRIRRKATITVGITAGLQVPPEYLTGYSNEINFTTHYQTADFENRNYIRENTALVRGIDHWEDADGLAIDKKIQTTTYLDGLSRPIQTVGKGTHYDESGSQWFDMVQSIKYVAGGSVDKAMLPYPTLDNPGKFKTNSETAQPAYYQSKFGDANAFAKVELDGSPLNQVLKTYAPGNAWTGSSVNVSGNVEVYNPSADMVKRWTVGYGQGEIPVAAGSYSSNGLIKSWVLDEKEKKVITYTDRSGNMVLKKVQLEEGTALSTHHDGWLCTYFVYDDFNQLRYTITPKAVNEAKNNGWVLTQQVADELCYWYDYDDLGRTIATKTAGKGAEYMVYDNRNRPIFTQDANARVKGEWMAILYDELNRPVMTGLFKTAETHANLTWSARYAASSNTITLNTTHGGTIKVNHIFLGNSEINDPNKFTQLSFTYYDDYLYNGIKELNPNEFIKLPYRNLSMGGNLEESGTTIRTSGLPTGGKTLVLNNATTPQYLTSTVYYDEEGRSIQSLADNIKGGTDINSVQYHFDGRALAAVETHTNPGTSYTNFSIVTKLKFNKAGNVTGIAKKLGNSIQVNNADLVTNPVMTDLREEKDQLYKITAAYKYDELGRLDRKTLSPNYNSGAGLETIDYSYNIRGWLTGINKDYALAENGNQWDHYFGLYIGYDNQDGKFAATQLNGQATGVQWKSQGNNTARKYDYVYDNANRLTGAIFKQFEGGSWNTNKADFSTGNVTYDENGNLLTMTQMGIAPGTTAPIVLDQLNYTYHTKSNRLHYVTDGGSNPANGKQGDFKDGENAAGTADYTYDVNGNMLTDNNKRVSNIIYNYLDKPELMTIAAPGGGQGGGTIRYVYDAGGSKMQKIVTENPTPANGNQTVVTTTTYIGAFIYTESSAGAAGMHLQMIMHEEGRIRLVTPYVNASDPTNVLSGGIPMPEGKQGMFDYFIKDHLTNIRATITEEVNKASGVCTMEDANTTIKQNEEATFGNPGTVNEVSGTRSDRPVNWTSGTVPPLTLAENQKVSRLFATGGVPKTGPNAFLKIMAGDMVRARVDYYYVTDPGSSGAGSNGLNALLTSFASVLSGPRSTPIVHGQGAAVTTALGGNAPLQNFYQQQPGAGNTNAPRAYMNWIFFDEQFNYVSAGSGFARVQQAGNGAAALVMGDTKATQNGYVYVYLSNESNEAVYFDNFTVSHDRGQLIAEDHYYAYGLRIAAISSRSVSSSLNPNLPRYGYQGRYNEEVTEFELNYNEFFLRTYDPQIGRWTTPDPFDQFASPYIGMGGDPANNTDPSGGWVSLDPIIKTLEGVTVYGTRMTAVVTATANTTLTIISTTVSTISIAGNAFIRDLVPGLPHGWIAVQSTYGDHLITNYYFNDVTVAGNEGGKLFKQQLAQRYNGQVIALYAIGNQEFDYETLGKRGGKNIRLKKDGLWTDRSEQAAAQSTLGRLHIAMDYLGIFVPGINILNGSIYWLEGNETAAMLSTAGMLPIKIKGLKAEMGAADDLIKNCTRDLSKPSVVLNFTKQAAAKGEQLLLKSGVLHKHHVFPKEFKKWFKAKDININKWCVRVSDELHKVLHKGAGGGVWNARWKKFKTDYPNASQSEIFKFGEDLLKEFNLEHLPYVKY